MTDYKHCPFCDEEIRSNAIKCKHCGSMLSGGDGQQNAISLIRNNLAEKFEILEEIGKGGMSTVYKARQKNLGRIVALKVLPQQFLHDEEFIFRFVQEAQSAAKLNHPNIITIFDVGNSNDAYYISMEYLEGETLYEKLKREKHLKESDIESILFPIASGLDYAHSQGVIHRDIKSSNIFLTTDGRSILMDFGIAKANDSTQRLTQSGTVLGTPEYMSPEQARGDTLDSLSDIYSFSVVVYEMLTGRLPFRTDNILSTMNLIANNMPTPPNGIYKRISEEMNARVLKGISKESSERFSTARGFFTEEICVEDKNKKRTEVDEKVQEPEEKQIEEISTEDINVEIPTKSEDPDLNIKTETKKKPENKNISKPQGKKNAKSNPNFIKFLISVISVLILMLIILAVSGSGGSSIIGGSGGGSGKFEKMITKADSLANLKLWNEAIGVLEESVKYNYSAKESIFDTIDHLKAEQKSYHNFISTGDKAYSKGQWLESKINYTKAINIKSTKELENRLKKSEKEYEFEELNKQIQTKITKKNWKDAEKLIARALKIKSTAKLMDYQDHVRKALSYNDHISKGDSAFNNHKWEEALKEYEKAQAYNNTNEIKNKIAETRDKIVDDVENKRKHNELIRLALNAYKQGKWQTAIDKYKEAATLIPLNEIHEKDLERIKSEKLKMIGMYKTIVIAGGVFEMGRNGGRQDQAPALKVSIKNLRMSINEVPQALYEMIMNENPSLIKGDMYPVENVTWLDAIEFCNKLSYAMNFEPVYTMAVDDDVTCDFSKNGYRLPTEAEWEFAALGGNNSKNYKYSGSNDINDVARYYKNKDLTPEIRKRNKNELGLFDMSGNVSEWCWDWYDSYSSTQSDINPHGPLSGYRKVVRGGSWYSNDYMCGSKYRNYFYPNKKEGYIGFRICRNES